MLLKSEQNRFIYKIQIFSAGILEGSRKTLLTEPPYYMNKQKTESKYNKNRDFAERKEHDI